MKTKALVTTLVTLVAGAASAETIGVSIVNFDNNFQTLLRNGMAAHAEELGVDIQIEDAANDMAKQLDQVNNFIANGVDAIVVTLVDSSAGPALSEAAEAAGVPWSMSTLSPRTSPSCPRARPMSARTRSSPPRSAPSRPAASCARRAPPRPRA